MVRQEAADALYCNVDSWLRKWREGLRSGGCFEQAGDEGGLRTHVRPPTFRTCPFRIIAVAA